MLPANFADKTRFGTRVHDGSLCVEWTGAIQTRGYGSVSVGDHGRTGLAHRVAWEHEHGPIPDDLTVDHLCRNKVCVNTRHMEIVTVAENTRRAVDDYNRAHPYYPCGHPRTAENTQTKTRKGGALNRTCRECANAYQRRKYAERKARALQLAA